MSIFDFCGHQFWCLLLSFSGFPFMFLPNLGMFFSFELLNVFMLSFRGFLEAKVEDEFVQGRFAFALSSQGIWLYYQLGIPLCWSALLLESNIFFFDHTSGMTPDRNLCETLLCFLVLREFLFSFCLLSINHKIANALAVAPLFGSYFKFIFTLRI